MIFLQMGIFLQNLRKYSAVKILDYTVTVHVTYNYILADYS